MRRPILAAACAAALGAVPAAAGIDGAPSFDMPVDCTPGEDCAVQHYVDHDPGPGATDFTCGQLSYDGHKGTDIRLPDRAAMQRNIAVQAAARGIVLRVRDGMPDISVRDPRAPSVVGREAGNGVVIDHGHGWETWYMHMRRGSVAVEPGQVVMAGTPIGMIGLSGETEVPHLHFEVHYKGRIVDPFTGMADPAGCGEAGTPLWSEEAARALAYRPTGLLAAGVTSVMPTTEGIRSGEYADDEVTRQSDVLVLWIALYGVQQGDRQTFRIEGPDGTALIETTSELQRAWLEYRPWAAARRPAYGWRPGLYGATYRLVRGAETIVDVMRTVELR